MYFRRIRMDSEKDVLTLSCPSIRLLSACATGRIFVKFNIRSFYKNFVEKLQICLKSH